MLTAACNAERKYRDVALPAKPRLSADYSARAMLARAIERWRLRAYPDPTIPLHELAVA